MVGCWGAGSEGPRETDLDGIVQGPSTPGRQLLGGCQRCPVSEMSGQVSPAVAAAQREDLQGRGQLLHGWRPPSPGAPKGLRENCYYFHEFNVPEG